NDLEQLLVLYPQGTAVMSAIAVADSGVKQAYRGIYLDFNLNLSTPPPCNTGFLPVRQQRSPSDQDYPDRPAGELYCRVPQDSDLNVRGVRNIPCETNPAKRAPTAEMCESAEQYVPLNDGYNWKGDPNATLSGQGIPQYPPGADPGVPQPSGTPPPAAPPVTFVPYDPATGDYIGPDGRRYTQGDLRNPGNKTWQSLLEPPP
ncbi:MAG: phospholipid/cholesterol/gamma-HCH transport system substrate-binding protein, partial [Mycobacterium sp.]|nr:phospholipid/cholesterol/gamma-HCH transport system substrate-binding protein [Mycobacterium sp.]